MQEDFRAHEPLNQGTRQRADCTPLKRNSWALRGPEPVILTLCYFQINILFGSESLARKSPSLKEQVRAFSSQRKQHNFLVTEPSPNSVASGPIRPEPSTHPPDSHPWGLCVGARDSGEQDSPCPCDSPLEEEKDRQMPALNGTPHLGHRRVCATPRTPDWAQNAYSQHPDTRGPSRACADMDRRPTALSHPVVFPSLHYRALRCQTQVHCLPLTFTSIEYL